MARSSRIHGKFTARHGPTDIVLPPSCTCFPGANGNRSRQLGLQFRSFLSHEKGADSSAGCAEDRRHANRVSSRGEIKERARRRAADRSGDDQLSFGQSEQAPRFLAEQSRINDLIDRLTRSSRGDVRREESVP